MIKPQIVEHDLILPFKFLIHDSCILNLFIHNPSCEMP